jgi:ATP-dependent helicase HrpA
LLAIVSGLSVPDARVGEDPPAGAVFEDSKSEFSALLKLWRAYRTAREGTRRELRRWCQERHLSVLRLSEWDDVHTQVVERARELGIVAQRQAASYTAVHRCLLAGFCTMVGARGEDGGYAGTRGVRFHIFPGSPLARRRPRWVMAASVIETSRVFARRVAEVEPMWIEAAASHLVKREYLEPDWDEAREEVVARERVGFLGLILSAGRLVNYGPIAPEESRLIFAREAIVYQRLRRRPDWLLANDAALSEAQRIEERLRTRDLLQSAESFVEFYDQRLPRQVSSAATLEYFSRHLSAAQRLALTLTPALIFARLPDAGMLAQFPENTRVDALSMAVEYHFAPGETQDGANLKVPLLALPGLTRALLDAAIPGLAAPRVEALLRSLPKEARRNLIPIAETAAAFLADATAAAADAGHLKKWLKEQRGVADALIRFDPAAIPAHLTVQVSVTQDGLEIASGTDLADLRRRCAAPGRAELERRACAEYAGGWRRFETEELPHDIALSLEQGTLQVYPTLMRRGASLQVQYEWSAAEAQRTWREGAARLARTMLDALARDLAKTIAGATQLLLSASPYINSDELTDMLLQLGFRSACFGETDAPRTRAAYERAVDGGRERLYPSLEAVSAMVSGWLKEAAAVRQALEDPRIRLLSDAAEETRRHLRRLLSRGAIETVSADWLRQLPRYLKAEQRRWQRNAVRGGESPAIARELQQWSARYQELERQLAAELRWTPKLEEFRFWIEEYRVSLYAQELKTLAPISAARLSDRAAEIEAWLHR